MTELQLKSGQSALFGYGSLLSRKSMERTLGRPYPGVFASCQVSGWRRRWNVSMPNQRYYVASSTGTRVYPARILYLNVIRDAGTLLNGILFAVEPEELAAFDSREWIYSRVDITEALSGIELRGGRAFLYTAKEEFVEKAPASYRDAAVLRSYLRIVETGLEDLGASFREGYLRSTDPFPESLAIDDQRDPSPPS